MDCSNRELKPDVVTMKFRPKCLVYNIVDELTDMGLLVRQDMAPQVGNLFSPATSATLMYSTSAESLVQSSGMKSSPDFHENMPLPTSTNPTPGPQYLGGKTLENRNTGQDSAKTK